MLELVGLHRKYGDVLALDDLSLDVPEGQLFGLLGPNGAGKTTALQILMGVRRADRGEVRWRGGTVDQEARLRFGYLPEQRGLYPRMRVADHLVYLARLHGVPKPRAEDRARSWLARLGLADRVDARVEQLSSGNQQRVQLAAALVHEPELIVLDEPFAGLDPMAMETLSQILRAQADEGRAIVFSSHQLDLVEDLCDAVAIVHRGRVVLAGSLEELRRSGPRRLRVEGPNADRWATGVPGVEVVGTDDGATVLRLDDDVDEQQLLRRALDAGPVTHFAFQPPRLSELFHRAVGP